MKSIYMSTLSYFTSTFVQKRRQEFKLHLAFWKYISTDAVRQRRFINLYFVEKKNHV